MSKKSSTKEKSSLKVLSFLKNFCFITIFVAFFGILIFLGASGLLRGHTFLKVNKSLVTLQAEYEEDFKPNNPEIDNATIENPKIILDPYKNSPLTALVIFRTEQKVSPTITVIGDDERTTISHAFSESTEHYLPIYGLYPERENRVIISYDNEFGKKYDKTTKEITIKTAPLPKDIPAAETIISESTEADITLDEQLYFFTPSSAGHAVAYDINGNVRWYLTQATTWDNARLKNGHMLISTERLINTPYYMSGLYEIDLLGKIYNEYSIPDGYHHDYFEMPNNNLLVASDNFTMTNNTVEDYIVEIDRQNGEIVKKFDLQKVLPTENTGNENYSTTDWFHNNSVWYDEKQNTIILSGRHADAVVGIDYASGELKWIVGDPTGWPKDYQKHFFKPVNDDVDFEWQWSQHAAMITPEGNLFVFDNGNNKSKITKDYIPATESYSRGVIYKLNYKQKTIEQVYQYGKERGSEWYSPYISDIDYLNPDHYLISSGGISSKDGIPSNQPAGFIKDAVLLSDTVEIYNDEVIFEIKLPTNTYRAEKMSAYANNEEFKLGKANRLGKLAKSDTNSVENGLLFGTITPDDNYASHDIKLEQEEDRLVISGNFIKNSNLRVILVKGFEKRYYKFRVTNEMHAALCVSAFVDPNTDENTEKLDITRYINAEGMSGNYNIYLEIGDQTYDTGKSAKF